MKFVLKPLSASLLFAPILLATVFTFSSCTKEEAGLSVALSYSLSGNANSSQSVPKNNSNGSGTFTGTYNASTKLMTYTTTWTNLTGAPLTGGLYTGASGQVGTSISAWNLGSGLSTSGSFSSSTTLNSAQEAELLAGRAYYILTTAANASSEIRGQITASAQ
ncbi:MAG: CHRD domain-containing protein [Chitinophagaceae bacterium]|nr:CHRD domain-containing protein [Chitinophagaceae bacterium]